jgi:hypothetical protein
VSHSSPARDASLRLNQAGERSESAPPRVHRTTRPTTTHINHPHRAAHAITDECTLPALRTTIPRTDPSHHSEPRTTLRVTPAQAPSWMWGESRYVRRAAAEREASVFVKGAVSVYGCTPAGAWCRVYTSEPPLNWHERRWSQWARTFVQQPPSPPRCPASRWYRSPITVAPAPVTPCALVRVTVNLLRVEGGW